MVVHTILGRQLPVGAAPGLVFHKWQPYDRFEEQPGPGGRPAPAFETKQTRSSFLENVAGRLVDVGADYRRWHEAFKASCADLGAHETLLATTQWRMVVGWGTNPSLEAGISLHPLLGTPYVPGSAIKGLLHHVAERQWLDEAAESLCQPSADLPGSPPVALRDHLLAALRIRLIFGSFAQQHELIELPPLLPSEVPNLRGWTTLESWWRALEPLRELPPDWSVCRSELELLFAGAPTGGALVCFDAVPDPAAIDGRTLQVDVLTPHYADYYGPSQAEPTDTQDPVPVTFLAVRPGVTFEFRLALRTDRLAPPAQADHVVNQGDAATPRNPWAGQGSDAIAALLREQVRMWLDCALAEWGVGAKTGAGYGYFSSVRVAATGDVGSPEPAPGTPVRPPRPHGDLPFAQEFLPPFLDASALSDKLKKARKLSPDDRSAVAARAATLYRAQIAKWLANPDPRKQELVGWLRDVAGLELEP